MRRVGNGIDINQRTGFLCDLRGPETCVAALANKIGSGFQDACPRFLASLGLVADSLRNMLGGAHASPGSGSHSTSPLAGPDSAQDSERGYSDKSGYVDEHDNDPGNYDDNDPGSGDMDI